MTSTNDGHRPRRVRTTRAVRLAGVVAASLLALAACAGGPTVGGSPSADGNWVLTSGSGPQGELVLVETHPVTLDIDGDSATGTAACNNYFGTIDTTDGWQLGPVGSTMMACLDPGVSELEYAYLQALEGVTDAEVSENELVLVGEGIELHFARAPVE